MKKELVEMFEKEYSLVDNVEVFFSPGRVNLIGEHIDYNGGLVFPAALTIGIYAAVRKRDDKLIRMRSKNIKGEVIVDLKKSIEYSEADDWGNYPKGVMKLLLEKGYNLEGADILFYSNLPDGAGLSSSAAFEVLTGYMLSCLSGKEIDRVELAKLCQRAENEFVGVNCGIMDQFSVATGRKNMAIMLDCSTLKYEYAPIELDKHVLVIMNTKKRRELADSKYNERRGECEKALSILNEKVDSKLKDLCSASIKEVEAYIEDEIIKRRAIHVVSENLRVKKALKSLQESDLEAFGRLMIESHDSLRDKYEVTGLHLDTIVYEALKVKGCIGARMTGAGFGGCAIALVEKEILSEFKDTVTKNYERITGILPEFYESSIGDGVYKL